MLQKAGPGAARPWRDRLRKAALPTVTVASGAMAMSSVFVAKRLRRRMPEPLADLLVNAGVFGAVAGMLFVAERVAPFREEWEGPDEEVPLDVEYLLGVLPVTALVSHGLVEVVSAGLPGYDEERGRRFWPRQQPLVVRVALALLVSELVHYWHHRWSHEIKALWLAHAAHHSEKRLYWATAARLHPADEVPLMVAQVVALAAVGVDRDALLAHNTLKSFHGLLQHSNIEGSTGPLKLVFSTAEQHRAHHGKAPGGSTVNYGAVLNVWDRVFGTAKVPAGDEPFTGEVGLRSMPDYPTSLSGQMVEPFRGIEQVERALARWSAPDPEPTPGPPADRAPVVGEQEERSPART